MYTVYVACCLDCGWSKESGQNLVKFGCDVMHKTRLERHNQTLVPISNTTPVFSAVDW